MIPPIKLPNNAPPLWLRQKLGTRVNALSASAPQAPKKSDTVNATGERSGGGSSASSRAVRPLVKEAPPAKVSIDAQIIKVAASMEGAVSAWDQFYRKHWKELDLPAPK